MLSTLALVLLFSAMISPGSLVEGIMCPSCPRVFSSYDLTGKSQNVINEFEEKLREKVTEAREADGNIDYVVWQQDDADKYTDLEVWDSRESLTEHGRRPSVIKFLNFLNENNIENELRIHKPLN